MAECLGYEENIYDALLDIYEPEMTTSQVETLFDEMKSGLVPLVKRDIRIRYRAGCGISKTEV